MWLRRAATTTQPGDVDAVAEAAAQKRLPKVNGSVAIVPIYGIMLPRHCWELDVMGGTATLPLRGLISELGQAANVGAIVLDIDSPGGVVDGVPELAETIRTVNQSKPVIAVANTMAASGAYWTAAAAGQIVASPSSLLGSIGVYRIHMDVTEAWAKLGVTFDVIRAGEHKAEGFMEPLSTDTREFWQSQVNDVYDDFLASVANGRGVTAKRVKDTYGEGRCFHAPEAVKRGMADRIGTLESVVAELMGRNTARKQRAARAHKLRAERIEIDRAAMAHP